MIGGAFKQSVILEFDERLSKAAREFEVCLLLCFKYIVEESKWVTFLSDDRNYFCFILSLAVCSFSTQVEIKIIVVKIS